MQSRAIRSEEIAAYGTLLGHCFAEENWNRAMIAVLDDPQSREAYVCGDNTVWVEAYAQSAHAWVVEDLQGLVLFDFSNEDGMTIEMFHDVNERAFAAGIAPLSTAEQERITARRALMEEGDNVSWMSALFPRGYAHIGAICVNPVARGTGVFGALIDPLIAECTARKLPLCLETYAAHLVGVYGSRGFKVIDTMVFQGLELTQYNMVRLPD